MKYPLMKCGHTANAIFKDRPCCIICAPNKNAFEINKDKNSLKGRKSKCIYCEKTKNSSWNLPFFKYLPNERYDEYYCGCYGWS